MTNIILVGNPNCGKTTLFNTLTKSNNHVGNWHGVTVSVASKNLNYLNTQYSIHDLPGVYSLDGYSPEEKIALEFLNKHKNDIVINVCDANTLSRNLLLTLELLQQGFRVVLAINMFSEVKSIDYKKLSKMLKIPVVLIDARKKKCVADLFGKINACSNEKYDAPHLVNTQNNIEQKSVKFNYINKVLNACSKQKREPYGLCKLDKILLNKVFAIPIFFAVMLLIFAITFGAVGENFSILINNVFDFFADRINTLLCGMNISAWAHALIMQGVLGGIGVIVGFLPQVTLLFLCINFLEDVGYLSRVSIMFDGALKKIGLSGKSLFSILLGFGCTTTAMLTTRALDNINLKKRTALVVPFASCSAKLPVFALVCSAFFTKQKPLMVFGLYIFGIFVGLIVAAIASKITKKKSSEFILELPPLRMPTLKKTLKNIATNVLNFIKRIGGTLILGSIIVWVLTNISFKFKYVTNVSDSMLYVFANKISWLFKPLGFESPAIVLALLIGIVAKEMIISVLSISNGVVGSMAALATSLTLNTSSAYLTVPSALAFLVFVLLYSPCISALSVISKEIGKKFAVFVCLFQFALAYFCAFITRLIADLFIGGKILECIIVLAVLALAIGIVLKYKKNKNKCKECLAGCNGKTCLQKAK